MKLQTLKKYKSRKNVNSLVDIFFKIGLTGRGHLMYKSLWLLRESTARCSIKQVANTLVKVVEKHFCTSFSKIYKQHFHKQRQAEIAKKLSKS